MDTSSVLVVDDRIGSKELRGAFERQGIIVDLQRLDACDFAFIGRGVDNDPITIGIELKRLRSKEDGRTDLMQSLRSGRLAGSQLGGMQAYDRAWLITEGIWRANEQSGVLEVLQFGDWKSLHVQMKDVEAQLFSIIIRGGFHYWHCPKPSDTIRFVTGLFHWWTSKPLNEHGKQTIYLPPPDRAMFVEPSPFVRMVYAGVDKIGYEKALALETHFGTFDRLYSASLPELREVQGIGTTLAKRIYTVLHASVASTQ